MKLGLGTVQFGQAYGISNTRGRVPVEEAAAILARAHRAGITILDTAPNYSEAEAVLAALETKNFRIVTKTINLENGLQAVLARARQSADRLGADTLLVHAAGDLLKPEGAALWMGLQDLREQGVFRKIGFSAYAAEEPAVLARRFKPDVMQIPFSLLDQRLLADGSLGRIKEFGVEIHARSLFLQGLLFLAPEQLPAKLKIAAPHLATLRASLTAAATTPLAAALGFVLARPEIDVALVGVTSVPELKDILTAAATPLPALDWASYALTDETVLTPSLW